MKEYVDPTYLQDHCTYNGVAPHRITTHINEYASHRQEQYCRDHRHLRHKSVT